MSDDRLQALLEQSRRNNEAADVTGMLMYRNGRFIQLLEGPDDAVRERLAVIEADLRHHDLTILLEESIDGRQFPDWTMGYPVTGQQSTTVPGYRQSFDDLDRDDAEPPLKALRSLTRWFQVFQHDR